MLPPMAAVLDQARTAQESLMLSVVTIRDGADVFDPDAGTETWIPGDTVYDGPANVQALTREAREYVAGAQAVSTSTHAVKLPHTAAQPLPGHRVDVTASPDPFLVGKWLTVDAISGNDFVTARRVLATLNLG